MKKRKSVTIKDVAKKAQVSISTVSHVLNNTASISSETKSKVMEAVHELNYTYFRPESSKNIKKRQIAVFAPDISNEFYTNCVRAINTAAWHKEYTVLICEMCNEENAQIKYLQNVINSGIDGIIFLGGFLKEKYILEAAKHLPVILGDRKLLNHSLPTVQTDNVAVLRRLIAMLYGAGYRKIGLISEDLEMTNIIDRYMGYKMGLEENGLATDERYIFCEKNLRLDKLKNSYRFVKELLSSGTPIPEVFVTTSDLIAMGAMTAFKESGFTIPWDIGVTGFDDITVAAHTRPTLTTVAQNMEKIGTECFASLYEKINNPQEDVHHTVVDAQIIIRDSVCL